MNHDFESWVDCDKRASAMLLVTLPLSHPRAVTLDPRKKQVLSQSLTLQGMTSTCLK